MECEIKRVLSSNNLRDRRFDIHNIDQLMLWMVEESASHVAELASRVEFIEVN